MAALVAVLALSCSGCPILCPPPPPLPQPVLVAALNARAEHFRSLADSHVRLKLRLKGSGGWHSQPSIGGALAFDSERPGLWLRGEKLGQQVLALRATDEGFSLKIFPTEELVTGSAVSYQKLPFLIDPREVRFWFSTAEAMGLAGEGATMALERDCYRFDVAGAGGGRREVYVDRRRLVVRRIVDYLPAPAEEVYSEVLLDDYGTVDGWDVPRLVTISRPLDGYKLELKLGKTTLNPSVRQEFFKPLEQAPTGWRHIDLDVSPPSDVEFFGGGE